MNTPKTPREKEFFANKQAARDDYTEAKCDAFNSGDMPPSAADFIQGHCAGQRSQYESARTDRQELVACVLEMDTILLSKVTYSELEDAFNALVKKNATLINKLKAEKDAV